MKVLIILGHPQRDSLCGALAQSYQEAALAAGADVRTLYLGEIQFDPLRHKGYQKIQTLEQDLVAAQEAILWAEHLVFVYPIWWGTLPALLKGFFDRAFLPGFAFKFHDHDQWWDKLLAGRSARLLVTMDTPPWFYNWLYRAPGHNTMRHTILGFCGIKPVKITSFGPVRDSTPAQREKWLASAQKLGGNLA